LVMQQPRPKSKLASVDVESVLVFPMTNENCQMTNDKSRTALSC
jgi:hypothetical protein